MAEAYCKWRGARLPTEAEWEKVAQGEDNRIYSFGSDISCILANFYGCEEDTNLVLSNRNGVSFYGSYQMTGNVWEWVQDWFSQTYYSSSPKVNPLGPQVGDKTRVLRGGSFLSPSDWVRNTYRGHSVPTTTSDDIGFRCARSVTP